MAESILSAFLTVVFEKLASEPLKKIARSKGIDSELKKLKRTLDQIQDLLNDASQKEINNEAIKRWLNGLQHLAYDIDDLLDDLATEAIHRELTRESGASTSMVRKLIPSCCTILPLNSRMHAKLDDIATKLQELVEAKNNLGLSVITNEKPKIERYETSLVGASRIVGREGDKNKLLQKLLGDKDESGSQNFSIVPIVGMGGVGKTTLARLLYDEKEVNDHFELKAWVCVSDEFSVPNISRVIYQSVTGENKEFADLNLLQEALKEKLQNKLFLIVLDDVWSESYNDWDKLVGPFLVGSPGSRIIMTTRKEQLLRKLGFSHHDCLQGLSHDDALSLFAQHALGVDNFDSHPTLGPYGEGFVKKCDGLPLALQTLGRLLRTKTDEEEWKELLGSEIWRLENGDNILLALRLSYNDLSATLKLLFAYCSLFPKDYVFDKEELILLWMAEGFLQHSTTNKSMERLGLEYFEELLSRSFFQQSSNDESLFVMHDLMNDLAMSVAGDFFSRLDIRMKKEYRKESLEIHRHMSFVCENYMSNKRFEPFKGAKSLRTFLALSVGVVESWDVFYLSNKVLNDLLHELPLLRVLSLSNLNIWWVPEFIGSLKHLRDTPLLKKMPLGIGELKSLRTLTKIIVGMENHFALTDLKKLKNLHGKISILELGNVQNAMNANEANLSQNRFSELELDWGNVFNSFRTETNEKEVLSELKPHTDTLKKLDIRFYRGIEFPNWVGDPSFLWLTRVSIRNCVTCTSLPSLGQLPSLKELIIEGMDEVKIVGLEFLGTSSPAFPSLEILRFVDMKGWEVWSAESGGVGLATFPSLQELTIQSCPNLYQVSLGAIPSLRVLYLTQCGHGVLTTLVHVASSITMLEIRGISGLTDQLWRGVTKYLGAVEEISIDKCDEIRYLWESESEASKVLVNLRTLHVSSCSNLVSLGEKEEDNCGSYLTSLRTLLVYYCNSLEHCNFPDNVEDLHIRYCDSITFVSFLTGRWQKLKTLSIAGCKELPEKELRGGECSFIHLTRLIIEECSNMESFPDLELPNLTSLTDLTIQKCTSMDASFPHGLWPPKLCRLEIGGLKKPISEWGPHNFPTSLVDLILYGGPFDDAKNFDQLSHILPSSLTSLRIQNFRKLELVSTGLQHLTSLQRLFIFTCPKTKDLPEKLLPSLLILWIFGCRNLKERISRGGSYWPHISLIPCFNIHYFFVDE
uniref:NB-ARC domains-containing protein n=1 Tax=Lactuca sativa TaxID=4236 RepID=A0A9R1W818_LACSA|nr:hypothetical protein LSAT_V11C300148830 [Lactuca sativa]